MNLYKYLFKALLTTDGWLEQAVVSVDNQGKIQALHAFQEGEPIDEQVDGFALPGFQNAHSHAFQYAMAGLAEYHEGNTDDFWSWRNAMYELALQVDPEQLEAIASQLYAQMACMGYTSVAEFHYLHHQNNGSRFDNPSEMGQSLMRAAQKAGIHLTLIPILYQQGGINQPPTEKQKRFIHTEIEDYFRLIEASSQAARYCNRVSVGIGAHSIRAVNHENLSRLIAHRQELQPFHIHISEQLKEVEDSVRYLGKRPVEWLFSNFDITKHFHLVHATHLTSAEIKLIADAKANVVLCPSTEANLGDGIFPLNEYYSQNGRWSIGTDSHIGLNHLEELRWLDYAQRLVHHKRTSFIHNEKADGAQNALLWSWQAGRRAMGQPTSEAFAIGEYFDAVVINAQEPLIASTSVKHLCNTLLYAQNNTLILGTIAAGKWIVRGNEHVNNRTIRDEFLKSLKQLKVR